MDDKQPNPDEQSIKISHNDNQSGQQEPSVISPTDPIRPVQAPQQSSSTLEQQRAAQNVVPASRQVNPIEREEIQPVQPTNSAPYQSPYDPSSGVNMTSNESPNQLPDQTVVSPSLPQQQYAPQTPYASNEPEPDGVYTYVDQSQASELTEQNQNNHKKAVLLKFATGFVISIVVLIGLIMAVRFMLSSASVPNNYTRYSVVNEKYTYSFEFVKSSTRQTLSGLNFLSGYLNSDQVLASGFPATYDEPCSNIIGSGLTPSTFSVGIGGHSYPVCNGAKQSLFFMTFKDGGHWHELTVYSVNLKTSLSTSQVKPIFASVKVLSN